MRNRKSILYLLIFAVILTLGLTGCSAEKAAAEADRKALEDAVLSGSAALGISDLKITGVEYAADADGKQTTWYVTHAESEQFGKLTYDEMVVFFRDLHADADVSIAHHIGCQADMFAENPYGGLQISSGGHTYMYRFHNKSWLLYEDGKVVFDSAEKTQPSADADESGITLYVPCLKCGGDGVTHDSSEKDDNIKCIRCGGRGKVEKTFANTDEYDEYMKNAS